MDQQPNDKELIEQLTKRLADLESELNAVKNQPADVETEAHCDIIDTPPPPTVDYVAETLPPTQPMHQETVRNRPNVSPTKDRQETDPQEWLARIGIGLVLFGGAFLFKYSIDMGWVTPAVRILFGLVLSGGLLSAGTKLRDEQMRLSQILFGGGIALLYVCIWAATQLYQMVPPALGLMGMLGVTAGAFSLSFKQSEQSLTIVGTLGGLLAPFIIDVPGGSVAMHSLYCTFIFAWGVWLYQQKNWPIVLTVTTLTTWLALWSSFSIQDPVGLDRVIAQVVSLITNLVPMILVWGRLFSTTSQSESLDNQTRNTLFASCLLPTLGVAIHAHSLWDLTTDQLSTLLAVLGGLQALYGMNRVQRGDRKNAAISLAGLVTLASAAAIGMDDGWQMLAAVAVGVGALHLARQSGWKEITMLTHLMFGWQLYMIFFDLIGGLLGKDLEPFTVFATVVGIAAALYVSQFMEDSQIRRKYEAASFVTFMLLVQNALEDIPGGGALTSLIWGISGVGLFVHGVRAKDAEYQNIGKVTILLVVIKMFLIDLATLEAIWKILAFLSVGGAFLVGAYWTKKKGKEPL